MRRTRSLSDSTSSTMNRIVLRHERQFIRLGCSGTIPILFGFRELARFQVAFEALIPLFVIGVVIHQLRDVGSSFSVLSSSRWIFSRHVVSRKWYAPGAGDESTRRLCCGKSFPGDQRPAQASWKPHRCSWVVAWWRDESGILSIGLAVRMKWVISEKCLAFLKHCLGVSDMQMTWSRELAVLNWVTSPLWPSSIESDL